MKKSPDKNKVLPSLRKPLHMNYELFIPVPCIAIATVLNFNAVKGKKKETKTRIPKWQEYDYQNS